MAHIIEHTNSASEEISQLRRAYEREKQARRQAEELLESKSLELYEKNKTLAEQNAVLRSAEQYRFLVDELSDIIFQVDNNGHLIFLNKVWTTITHVSVAMALGRSFVSLVHADSRPLLQEQFERVWQGDSEKIHLTIGIEFSDLKLSWFELQAQVVKEENIIKGIAGRLTDITDKQTAQFHLYKALEQEKQLNTLREQLISTISHEFRTPLTAIKSSAELLLMYSDRLNEETRKRYCTTIDQGVDSILNIITDILFVDSLERGTVRCVSSLMQLDIACHDILSMYKPKKSNYIPQIQHTKLGNPHLLPIDSTILAHAIHTLLDNAIQHRSEPIFIETLCTDNEGIITLYDSGVGLPKHVVDNLFTPFVRGQNSYTQSGGGMGLYTVQRLIHIHGGTITHTPREGFGTCFTITLPRFTSQQ